MLHDVLGLTEAQERVYRELVGVPSATPDELATRLRRSLTETATVLTALERLGLAAHSGGDAARFVAAPPALALGALLARRQNELAVAEGDVAALHELYQSAASDRGISGAVDVVHGAEAVGERFRLIQLGARREVMAFVKLPVMAVSAEQNLAEQQAVARGVSYRAIVEREHFEQAGGHRQAEQAVRQGEQVRITDRLPLKLVIIDRETAFLPLASLTSPGGVGALVVHASGLLDALLALFEEFWARSFRVVVAEEGGAAAGGALDDLDRQIIALLLAGYTDEATAKQLRTSLRTVQRRVRALMTRTKVQTRIQLGWRIAEQGWI